MTTAAETSAPSRRLQFLEPYRRITSSGQMIPEIDGLRFLAIFSVFVYHLAGDVLRHSVPGYSDTLQSNGLFRVTQILNFGVPLFFAISGFVLSLPFASAQRQMGKPVSIKKYFLRRVTRLEPPYLLCLLLFFIVKLAAAKGTAGQLWPNLLASIFYLHNAVFARPSDINVVAWSLEVEVQFYILVPLMASVFTIANARRRRSTLAGLVLAATAVSALVSHDQRLQLSLLGYAQYFLVGFLFTEAYLSCQGERSRKWIWDLVSVVGWSFLILLLVGDVSPGRWIMPWLILILYVAAFHGIAMNGIVSNPWIVTVGGMCYTIYVLHNYIIAGAGMITERVHPGGGFAVRLLVQFLLISPIVLVIGALYFRFVERPCMHPDWLRRGKASIQLRILHQTDHPFSSVADRPFSPETEQCSLVKSISGLR
jgi:peptidoglycan/LPS O-acetylase OafA/YrhL